MILPKESATFFKLPIQLFKGVSYPELALIGLFFSFPFLAIRSFLVGITETRPLNLAALTAVLMNIPLNWLLIFRYDMGISGAAIGSSFAELCSLLILVAYMFLCVRKHKYGLSWRIDIKILKTRVRDKKRP